MVTENRSICRCVAAIGLLCDAVDLTETQPCSASTTLCGEERFISLLQNTTAGACVVDWTRPRSHPVLSSPGLPGLSPPLFAVEVVPLAWHLLHCVIENDQLHLAGSCHRGPQILLHILIDAGPSHQWCEIGDRPWW